MANAKPSNGGKVINLPASAGALAYPGDVIQCATSGGSGWHVVLKTHIPPVGGYPAGSSNDLVHWSVGPSQTGDGGYGDGRINGGANGTPAY